MGLKSFFFITGVAGLFVLNGCSTQQVNSSDSNGSYSKITPPSSRSIIPPDTGSYLKKNSVGMKNQEEIKRQIEEKENEAQDAKQWLLKHPNVYKNNSCNIPERSSLTRPPVHIQSMDEASNLAWFVCGIQWKGCDILLSNNNKLDTVSKKFLAGESCSAVISSATGGKYNPYEAPVGAAGALGDKYISEGKKLRGYLLKGGAEIYKAASFVRCLSEKEKEYKDWVDPSRLKKTCQNKVSILHKNHSDIKILKSLL